MCFSNSEEILSYQRILYHLRCSRTIRTYVLCMAVIFVLFYIIYTEVISCRIVFI
nr:MAG TPA: hypothetical protein [Caudoviricetes sp.]DAT22691.1 MAG TPA: hypothetical protein [Caudoviricetes sp.]